MGIVDRNCDISVQSYKLREFDNINAISGDKNGYTIVYHRTSYDEIIDLLTTLYQIDGFNMYSMCIYKLDICYTLNIRFLCEVDLTDVNLKSKSNLIIYKGLLASRIRRTFHIKMIHSNDGYTLHNRDCKSIKSMLEKENPQLSKIYEVLFQLCHKVETTDQMNVSDLKNEHYYLYMENDKLNLAFFNNFCNQTYIIEETADLLYLIGYSHDMIQEILYSDSVKAYDKSTVEVNQEMILKKLTELKNITSFRCSTLGSVYSIEVTYGNEIKENINLALFSIIINSNEISLSNIIKVYQEIASSIISIEKICHLSFGSSILSSVEIVVRLNQETTIEDIRKRLYNLSHKIKCDINVEEDRIQKKLKRMVSFDMDSTLIMEECIDEMAKMAGVTNEVATITKNAMLGNIDFKTALKQRVAYLKGLNAEELFNRIISNIHYTPGAISICKLFKKLKCKMLLISGGFIQIVDQVKDYLGIQYGYANHLEIDLGTCKLTGSLQDGFEIVDGNMKKQLFESSMDTHNINNDLTIAVGDGANDIMMLSSAGMGIAFKAKPITQEKSKFHINYVDTLLSIIFMIGISHIELTNTILSK